MKGGVDDADEEEWRRERSRGGGQKTSGMAPGNVTNGVEEEKASRPEMAPRMVGGVDDADEKGWRRGWSRENTGKRHQGRRKNVTNDVGRWTRR